MSKDRHTVAGAPRAFGRAVSADVRDHGFGVARRGSELPQASRYWCDHQWVGDQGASSQCVGYAWAHWLSAAPIRQWLRPQGLYELAQYLDEWDGTDYEGTTVRAGAKALASLGYIAEYRWAKSIHEIAETLLNVGPVVVGTDWLEGMSYPMKSGAVYPEGNNLGGHAYILTGVSVPRREFRLKNSWGKGWGRRGKASIGFDAFAELLDRDGEACLGVEFKPTRPQ